MNEINNNGCACKCSLLGRAKVGGKDNNYLVGCSRRALVGGQRMQQYAVYLRLCNRTVALRARAVFQSEQDPTTHSETTGDCASSTIFCRRRKTP